MSHTDTIDFFERLEAELHRAASEPVPSWRRSMPGPRVVLVAAAIASVVALALVPLLALVGGGGGGPTPPATSPQRTVVATGSAPVGGPWRLESYTRNGLPCVSLVLLDEGIDHGTGGWGACGESPRTPGFARIQHSVPNAPGAGLVREVLVYGRVPAGASAVVITLDGEIRERVRPFDGPPDLRGDFYLVAIAPELTRGHVNWLDGDGREGSRGIELLPP